MLLPSRLPSRAFGKPVTGALQQPASRFSRVSGGLRIPVDPAASVTASCQSRPVAKTGEIATWTPPIVERTPRPTRGRIQSRRHCERQQSPPSHRLDRRAFVGLTGASGGGPAHRLQRRSETVSNASGDDAVAMRSTTSRSLPSSNPRTSRKATRKGRWPDFVRRRA